MRVVREKPARSDGGEVMMVVFFRKSGAGFREREVGARQACDTPFGAVPLRCERKAERDETGRGKLCKN